MRLLGVELTRLRVRRTAWVVALAAVLVAIGFAVKTGYDSRPITADEKATAAAQAEIAGRSGDVRRVLRVCEHDPAGFVGPGATEADCARMLKPSASEFIERGPLRLGVVMRHNGISVVLLLLVLVAVLGAAFAGSDWASGSVATQLLAEPRRGRVWAAKAGAATLGGLVVAAATMAAFWIPLRVLASHRGLPVLVGAQLGWYVVRVLVLAAVVALLAYALTMLFRQTVITIGVLLGISVGAELLLGLVPIGGSGRLAPGNNVYAWVVGRTSYLDPSVSCSTAGCDRMRTLEMWPAAALVGAVLVVVCAASVATFRRRDLP